MLRRPVLKLSMLLIGPCVAMCCGNMYSKQILADGREPQRVDRQTLVDQLGSDQFRQRELAARRLIRLGPSSLTFLDEALKNGSTEVRRRATEVASAIRKADQLRRTAAFEARLEGDGEAAVPGWNEFRSRVKDAPNCRALYAQMLRAEWDLLEAAASDSSNVGALLIKHAQKHNRLVRYDRKKESIGIAAAVMYVGAELDAGVLAKTGRVVDGWCRLANVKQCLTRPSEPLSQSFRQVLINWINIDATNYYGSRLADEYEIREGIPAIQRVALDTEENLSYRRWALHSLAKLGNVTHVAEIASVLEDETVCYMQRVGRGKKPKFVVQFRDIALGVSLHLSGQDPKDYNFDKVKMGVRGAVFQLNTLGFSSDEKREDAFRKWGEFLAAQKLPTQKAAKKTPAATPPAE